jgi:hypothetical protein
VQTYSTSGNGINPIIKEIEECDLRELDIAEEQGLIEYNHGNKEKKEDEEVDSIDEEGNKEDKLVSSHNIQQSVSVDIP